MERIYMLITGLLCLFPMLQAQHISQSEVEGNRIVITTRSGERVDYKIYGFCYSVDPSGHQFESHFESHLELLKSIHANSIRTYRPLAAYNSDETINYVETRQMLDRLAEAGISIAVGFDLNRDLHTGLYKAYLDELGSHPALLAILLGNEYNYHYIGSAPEWADEWFTKESWLESLSDAVVNIRKRCNRIIAAVHGEVPTVEELAEYKACGVDMVMPNVYRGNSFYDLFEQWNTITHGSMPLVVSEFGRSSVSANGNDASSLQSEWLMQLWGEINNHICGSGAGGYLFELVDESWKSGANELTGSEKHFGVFTEKGDFKPVAVLLSQLWKDKTDCGPVTGVETQNLVNSLKAYSNPVEIYSLNGTLVKQYFSNGNTTEIKLSLPKGLYIVKAGNETNKIRVK